MDKQTAMLETQLRDIKGGQEMKEYPIDIDTLHEIDDGSYFAYYTKGHHSAEQFIQALIDSDVEFPYKTILHQDDVKHGWWRFIPITGHALSSMRIDAAPHSRGSFPVTFIWAIDAESRFDKFRTPGGIL